jgi:hypothetical protein
MVRTSTNRDEAAAQLLATVVAEPASSNQTVWDSERREVF